LGLSLDEAERTRKALGFMSENLRHPGLQVKKVQGTDNIWEARAGLIIRITIEIKEDAIILRNVGRHDEALKKP
jgi:mRNA-degrading endonuclease RelE of RelBE toxin-antitoxin system